MCISIIGSFAMLPVRPIARPVVHIVRAKVVASSEDFNGPCKVMKATFGREAYDVSVQPAGGTYSGPEPPPLVLIPPVGVGIDRKFYDPLQRAWAKLGAPAAMHSIDLLGTGSATPKPRRFYSPEIWADQIDGYIRNELKQPCVLVVQGGLLPSALEVWRRSGSKAIAGVSILSPPPLRFFTQGGANRPMAAPRVRKRDGLRRALLFWRRDERSDFSASWNKPPEAHTGQATVTSVAPAPTPPSVGRS